MGESIKNVLTKEEYEKFNRRSIASIIGSAKHEGFEDPYGFSYELLYWYGMDEITGSEYFRLHEEYWMAESRMKGKKATPIIKEHAEAPLVSPRSKELFKKWFINGLINTKAICVRDEHK